VQTPIGSFVPGRGGRTARTLSLLVVAFTGAVSAQGPSFKADVRLVRLDVSVLGRDKQPVHDLTAADFRVTEGGRLLAIRTFDVVTVPGAGVLPTVAPAIEDRRPANATPQAESAPPAPAPALGAGRLIVLVMDDDMTPANPKWGTQARNIARSIVARMGRADNLAVQFTRAASTRLELTTDRQKLLAQIDTYSPGGYLALPPTDTGADEVPRYWRSMSSLSFTTAAIASLTDRQEVLVYVGPGIPVNPEWGRDYHGDLTREMNALFRAAERANVVVYTFDPTGSDGLEDYVRDKLMLAATTRATPGGSPAPMDGRILMAQAGARDVARWTTDFSAAVAANTGGRALIWSDNAAPAIEQMFVDTSVYYVLAVEPRDAAPDDRFHEVRIEVARPDVEVRARRGYHYTR
jgi:VWFA-related protein